MEIHQKWGFGCAPLKPDVLEKRREIVGRVAQFIGDIPRLDNALMEDVSETKGLFNRVVRQDQWDWFTVWCMLGRPGRKLSHLAANALKALRDAIKSNDMDAVILAVHQLKSLGVLAHFSAFQTGGMSGLEGGQIYILSTRENPTLLKVGYTTRSVEKRVSEINAVTGIAIPYGVRAVWVVKDAKAIEQQLHGLLAPYRIRHDREFFRMPFETAFKLINDSISKGDLEL